LTVGAVSLRGCGVRVRLGIRLPAPHRRYAARRSKSWRGVDADWEHASGCIELALAKAGADDVAAVEALRGESGGGIPNWETAMGEHRSCSHLPLQG
jgi:hypothetical protein